MPIFTMRFALSAAAEVEIEANTAEEAALKAEEYYENAVVDVNDREERLASSLTLAVVGGPHHVQEKADRSRGR